MSKLSPTMQYLFVALGVVALVGGGITIGLLLANKGSEGTQTSNPINLEIETTTTTSSTSEAVTTQSSYVLSESTASSEFTGDETTTVQTAIWSIRAI